MKRIVLISLLLALAAVPSFAAKKKVTPSIRSEAPAFTLPSTETDARKAERLKWWTDARFGMFIHWGLYSMPARHEWIKTREQIPEEQYDKYFKYFNPDLFEPEEWAKKAREAGMKYVVLTTKHHEGFCMWDSRFTDYKVTNTPAGRDVLREFVDAFRVEGIKIGFYYSLLDWHHPHFTIDRCHPLRPAAKPEDESYNEALLARYAELNKGRDMEIYRQYMKDQVRELLTNYGPIDIMWFDYSYPGPTGKGRDDWDSEGLLKLAKSLQPDIIVDSRLDLMDVPGGWDFVTPEQYKVSSWPVLDGKKVAWETCQTFSGSWGYYRDEATWKSPAQLIELLVETVSKGGNLIMNVGPTSRGEFDSRACDRLAAFSKWMHGNARSIYGCTEAPEGINAPERTLLTYNPEKNVLYIHLLDYPMGRLNIDFGDKVDYAQFLHDGSEVKISSQRNHSQSGDTQTHTFFNLPVVKPDVEIPVIEVFLK